MQKKSKKHEIYLDDLLSYINVMENIRGGFEQSFTYDTHKLEGVRRSFIEMLGLLSHLDTKAKVDLEFGFTIFFIGNKCQGLVNLNILDFSEIVGYFLINFIIRILN